MRKNPDSPMPFPVFLYRQETLIPNSEGQCDCACAATIPLNQYLSAFASQTAYVLAAPFQTVSLTDDYVVVTGGQANAIVLNSSALTMADHFRSPCSLEGIPDVWGETWGEDNVRGLLVDMVQSSLLLPVKHTPLALPESRHTLTAWLHITDRCNLRCAYCYLPHKREDMPLETGRAVIEATFRSAVIHTYRAIKLKYAGGEPLIRFAEVANVHRYAQHLANQYEMDLQGVILSNGTLLTPDIVKQMQDIGLRLMISLDGLGSFHDGQRFYSNGHGSFEDVSRGIELSLDLGLVPDISITVSGRNAAGLAALVTWVLEHNLPFSLNFYRENEHSASYGDLKLEEEQIIAGMSAAFRVIEARLPQHSLLASLVDRANLAVMHTKTCGVGDSYLVFDYCGQVSKCQMQLQRPITTIHTHDPLALIQADQIGIQNISVEEKQECQSCEWKYWCAGGCALLTYRATGRYDVKSPNCNIYKALYPQAVRLEGLRLLKNANI